MTLKEKLLVGFELSVIGRLTEGIHLSSRMKDESRVLRRLLSVSVQIRKIAVVSITRQVYGNIYQEVLRRSLKLWSVFLISSMSTILVIMLFSDRAVEDIKMAYVFLWVCLGIVGMACPLSWEELKESSFVVRQWRRLTSI